MKDYICVQNEFCYTIIINKSKFICTLIPLSDAEDGFEKVKAVAKKYSDATHNCYAFIADEVGNEMRFSDDGEPQGTAGMPMLQVLKNKNIYKTLAVVTRYFGGVKLGTGGLVSAYTRAVAEACDNAVLAKMIYSDVLKITLDYASYAKAKGAIVSAHGRQLSCEFDTDVCFEVAVPKDSSKNFCDAILELTLGNSKIKKLNEIYINF